MNDDKKSAAERAIEYLNALHDGPEESHIAADDLLVEFLKEIGLNDVAEAFERCKDRNRFWYA